MIDRGDVKVKTNEVPRLPVLCHRIAELVDHVITAEAGSANVLHTQ